MGEIADEHYERMMGLGRRQSYRRPLNPSCRYCGKKGLFWSTQYGSEWRLVDAYGQPHDCRSVPNADGFEDLTGGEA